MGWISTYRILFTLSSLSSYSVDEVIKKRVLAKNEGADMLLRMVYDEKHAVLKNLYAFNNPVLDIKGFSDGAEYAASYPFVPYQFIIIQKVLAEIRKHGNAGKHLAGGERSMLSGFQEAAQKVQDKDENALVPFYLFYDTVHTFLGSEIRRVIERCQSAADNHDGLEQQDVSVLKLLYLVRYIDDIRANVDNIAILMIDDIRTDKIALRASVKESLGRLLTQNYISCNGDTYVFLTDEEQKIAKEIRDTVVDNAQVTKSIANIVFGEIYPAKKFKYNKYYDFAYDQYIDDRLHGSASGGMRLRIITVASDYHSAPDQRLIADFRNNEAIVVLSNETPYFEELEQAKKIHNYIKGRNVSQLSETIQDIIRKHQQQAHTLEERAQSCIEKAIEGAKFVVHGEIMEIKTGSAKEKLDVAMRYLVESVYDKLSMVNKFVESDADIIAILNGADSRDPSLGGLGANNGDALNEISQWLELQNNKMITTSMNDVQRRYSAIPYGWREIDIAAMIAQLIVQQRISIRYGGAIVRRDDRKLVDYLRKKSEIDKAVIVRRRAPSEDLIRKSICFLRDYFGVMDIPSDEDGLISFVLDKFKGMQLHYGQILEEYRAQSGYPGRDIVTQAYELTSDVLSQHIDNVALLNRIVDKQEELLDTKDDMENVEFFFKSQRVIYDEALRQKENIDKERDYFAADSIAEDIFNTLSSILAMPAPYSRIGKLPELISKIKSIYEEMLNAKKAEVLENIRQCAQDVHQLAADINAAADLMRQADDHFDGKNKAAEDASTLIELDAMITQISGYKENICRRMEDIAAAKMQPVPANTGETRHELPKQQKIASVRRYDICPAKRLQTREDIDQYVEGIREKLMMALENCDGIQIN